MSTKSNVFIIGERIEDTMLIVLGQSRSGSWHKIKVQCDCGKVFIAQYMELYRGKYSCGCVRKQRSNAVDYTGVSAKPNTRENRGRKLTFLERGAVDGQWRYLCDCCATIFVLPRGLERSADRSLRDIAGQQCPNYLEFIPVDRLERLSNHLGDGRVLMRAHKAELIAEEWYKNHPERVARNPITRKIDGFYGYPKEPPGGFPRCNANLAALQAAEPQRPVADDPDDFAELAILPEGAKREYYLPDVTSTKRSKG